VAGARQIINGPDFTPLPNFLWEAAQHPSTDGPHWQQGVTWQERCGAATTVMDECIAVTGEGTGVAAQDSLSSTVTQLNRGATAFTVFAEFDCSPVGQGLSATDLQGKAEEALARQEAYQVSRAFWTGQAGTSGSTLQTTVWPHLAAESALDDPQVIRLQTAATIVTGGGASQDPAVALGVIESNLASCYGGEGVIHIPLTAFPSFKANHLVHRENPGDLWRTAAGNIVVPGSGYTGSSPAGAAPAAGTAWIYATGALFAYRSDVFVPLFPENFDRAENTVKYQASRTYLFGFECCHYAALVDIGVPTT
jgi:hypothetical protein